MVSRHKAAAFARLCRANQIEHSKSLAGRGNLVTLARQNKDRRADIFQIDAPTQCDKLAACNFIGCANAGEQVAHIRRRQIICALRPSLECAECCQIGARERAKITLQNIKPGTLGACADSQRRQPLFGSAHIQGQGFLSGTCQLARMQGQRRQLRLHIHRCAGQNEACNFCRKARGQQKCKEATHTQPDQIDATTQIINRNIEV